MRWLSRRVRPRELRALRADINLYRQLLPPSAVCFDVGANVGEKTEAMLRAGAARVISFEPCPPAIRELKARCAAFSNCVIVEAALGSTAAIEVLYEAAADVGKSSMVIELADWMHEHAAAYNVPVVTLDAAIRRFGRPDYCKIDVEGWEPEVLKGLTQSIPLISFEIHMNDDGRRKAITCLELLQRFGPSVVNLSPAETPVLRFNDWIPLAQFASWFPGDLPQWLPGDPYGDIWVKSSATRRPP
jgi:FkbM family methyltransferase